MRAAGMRIYCKYTSGFLTAREFTFATMIGPLFVRLSVDKASHTARLGSPTAVCARFILRLAERLRTSSTTSSATRVDACVHQPLHFLCAHRALETMRFLTVRRCAEFLAAARLAFTTLYTSLESTSGVNARLNTACTRVQADTSVVPDV